MGLPRGGIRAMLKLSNVEVMYSNVILVLRGISMEVSAGAVVTLLGANGAGKSTALKAISGLLEVELGNITDGSIEFEGERIDKQSPDAIAKMGVIQVLEGRKILEHLTSEENLRLGAYTRHRGRVQTELSTIYSYLPRLKDTRNTMSGYLSGGEQQMVVIGRALMARPKLMMLDEPSLGLAPMLVEEIFSIIKRINEEEKTTILLVEQNANVALSVSEYGYVMENGRIVLDGPAGRLSDNEDVKEFYLGLSKVGRRKSYREVKHYKRRKRWL